MVQNEWFLVIKLRTEDTNVPYIVHLGIRKLSKKSEIKKTKVSDEISRFLPSRSGDIRFVDVFRCKIRDRILGR